MARDSFTYLHLPMIAGIILFALGVKKTLDHTGDALEIVPAVGSLGVLAALLGGLIAYESIHFAQARARIRHAA